VISFAISSASRTRRWRPAKAEPAGVFADRMDRRRTKEVVDPPRAGVLLLLLLLLLPATQDPARF
jgi:hypothetical protein